MNEKFIQALEYVKYGWHIFPLHTINKDGSCSCMAGHNCESKGKHPMFKGWYDNATIDETVIKTWSNNLPNANIGIATGSKSGIIVLDIDPRHGGDVTLKALETKYGMLPPTATALTGGGGQHKIFKYPQGIKVPSKANFAQGLDTRSDGGLIVAVPSNHESGNCYKWKDGFAPSEITVSDAPQWLINMMRKPNKNESTNAQKDENINKGSRNSHLTSLAGSMRRRGMSDGAIYAALCAENTAKCKPPLDDSEVAKIAHSISRYEPSMQHNSLLSYKMNDILGMMILGTM